MPGAGCDHELARCRLGLHSRRDVRGFADRHLPKHAFGVAFIANDDEAARNAYAGPKGHARRRTQRANGVERGQSGAYGLLGVMFTGRWVAEIDVHARALVLGDESAKRRYAIGNAPVEAEEPA